MARARVAVFNAHADTVAMLHVALQHAGFETIDAPLHEFERGLANGLAFLRTHEPDVVVYDVSPPFERTAAFCCDLQEADEHRAWVITSTNPVQTSKDLRGRREWYELIGSPTTSTMSSPPCTARSARRRTSEHMGPTRVRRKSTPSTGAGRHREERCRAELLLVGRLERARV